MDQDLLNKSRKTSRKRIFLAISSFLIASSFISLAFAGYFGSEIKSFLGNGQALISGTFKDVVSSGQKAELLAEIDLGSSPVAPSSSSAVILNTSSTLQPETSQKSEPVQKKSTKLTPASGATAVVSRELPPAVAPPKLCSFEMAQNPSREVIFNEIAWMGSPSGGGKTASETASDEWLELKNNSSGTIDLSGSQILDSGGGIKIIFDANRKIEAGKFFLLERVNDDSVPGIAADKIYSGGLSNSGEWLKVFNSRCELLDGLDASSGWGFFGGDNITKQTLERNLSGLGWHTSEKVGGTPKSENSSPTVPLPPAQANGNNPASPSTGHSTLRVSDSMSSGQASPPPPPPPPAPEPPSPLTPTSTISHLVIAEVQITGGTGKPDNDFIKLYNPTSAAIDISNWKLRKRTWTRSTSTESFTESSIRVFPDGSRVEPQGYFLWANSDNGFSAGLGANVSSTQTIAVNNSTALLKFDGTLVDALAWGSGHVNPFVEGAAYPENPGALQKLGRKLADGSIKDTDNNAEDFELR